jgi:protein-disulfide isomerase
MHYVVHPQVATLPAWAACAAQKQGKFEEFEHKCWNEAYGKVNYDEALMLKFADDLKLDAARFKADMNGDACKQQVADHQKRLGQVGVTGTPAFFINGRYLSGARPIEQFKALVDEELKKANDAIAKGGVTPETYYQKMVFEAGKKSAM